MTAMIQKLASLPAKMQIELLQDYLTDALEDGEYHTAHAIETRLTVLRAENPAVVSDINEAASSRRKSAESESRDRCRDGFIARGID